MHKVFRCYHARLINDVFNWLFLRQRLSKLLIPPKKREREREREEGEHEQAYNKRRILFYYLVLQLTVSNTKAWEREGLAGEAVERQWKE